MTKANFNRPQTLVCWDVNYHAFPLSSLKYTHINTPKQYMGQCPCRKQIVKQSSKKLFCLYVDRVYQGTQGTATEESHYQWIPTGAKGEFVLLELSEIYCHRNGTNRSSILYKGRKLQTEVCRKRMVWKGNQYSNFALQSSMSCQWETIDWAKQKL